MIETIRHYVHVVQAGIREHGKRTKRSPHWRTVELAAIKAHPFCAACHITTHLQVHHIEPFNLHPEKELDPINLIVGCMGEFECHLKLFHGGSFDFYNPNVASDAAIVLANPSMRLEYEARAKAARLSLQAGARLT